MTFVWGVGVPKEAPVATAGPLTKAAPAAIKDEVIPVHSLHMERLYRAWYSRHCIIADLQPDNSLPRF